MDSKVCSQCKEDKPLLDFYRSKNKPGGYAYCCKQCSDKSNKNTREKFKSRYQQYRNNYKFSLIEQCNNYKMERGCLKCGEKSHPSVLDMHHLDPTIKEDSLSFMRTSWDRWLKEAEKCVVLCANCHRKFHAGMFEL